MWYHSAVALAGLLAGLIAAISGFGIGSLLTPVIAYHAKFSKWKANGGPKNRRSRMDYQPPAPIEKSKRALRR
jgi:hypothetical protein